MSSRKILSLGLDVETVEKLHKIKITACKDVLCRHYLDLINDANISCVTARNIIRRASAACTPTSITALEMLHAHDTSTLLPTSLPDLDRVLHGGIHGGGITEITGPSGCGKTQFCIMLSVIAVSDVIGSCSVIYIDTEGAFSPDRLLEMAVHRYPDVYCSNELLQCMASRVIVFTELTCSGLLKRLENLEECIIIHKVRLIVVDSIASPARRDFDPSLRKNLIERSNWLMKVAAILKYTADAFGIPVVVTNHITTRVEHGRRERSVPECMENSDTHGNRTSEETLVRKGDESHDVSYATAALGNSWGHCVNTRLIVQYVGDGGAKRQILVAKSPVAPFTKFTYTIEASGLVLEQNGAEHYSGTDPNWQRIRVRSSAALDSSQHYERTSLK